MNAEIKELRQFTAQMTGNSSSHVFSPEPPKPGQTPRLQLPGHRADETWRSRQEGLHLLAQGAFAGIRNPSAHDDVEWTEHEALERLAVLSVVARWADEAELVEPDQEVR